MKYLLAGAIALMALNACQQNSKKQDNTIEKMDGKREAIEDSLKYANAVQLQSEFTYQVSPKIETEPVKEKAGVDAADDPAIWYNQENPDESRVLGTDKKSGLGLYNLQGKLIDFIASGKINNVDLRYNFPYRGNKIALAAATERINTAVVLYQITSDSIIALGKPFKLDTAIIDDAYGLCMYQSPKTDNYYVFACGKNGNVQQLKVITVNNEVTLEVVRTITLASQTEGMAADDEEAVLYVAEEEKGIWKINAEPNAEDNRVLLEGSVGNNSHIAFDIEGLDIYYGGDKKGYLIASIQGNFSYAVFNKQNDNQYLGSFVVRSNEQIDGTEETDGLTVLNVALGEAFPNGLLVVQDGFNTDNGVDKPQNFKYIDWLDVATEFEDNLIVNPHYKVWE